MTKPTFFALRECPLGRTRGEVVPRDEATGAHFRHPEREVRAHVLVRVDRIHEEGIDGARRKAPRGVTSARRSNYALAML